MKIWGIKIKIFLILVIRLFIIKDCNIGKVLVVVRIWLVVVERGLEMKLFSMLDRGVFIQLKDSLKIKKKILVKIGNFKMGLVMIWLILEVIFILLVEVMGWLVVFSNFLMKVKWVLKIWFLKFWVLQYFFWLCSGVKFLKRVKCWIVLFLLMY